MDRTLRAVTPWETAPLTPRLEHIEDSIEDDPKVQGWAPTRSLPFEGLQQGFHLVPEFIGNFVTAQVFPERFDRLGLMGFKMSYELGFGYA